jgi:hypothetical protein
VDLSRALDITLHHPPEGQRRFGGPRPAFGLDRLVNPLGADYPILQLAEPVLEGHETFGELLGGLTVGELEDLGGVA